MDVGVEETVVVLTVVVVVVGVVVNALLDLTVVGEEVGAPGTTVGTVLG